MKKKEYTLKEFADCFDPPFTRQAILKNVDTGNLPKKRGRAGFIIEINHPHTQSFIKNSGRNFTEKQVEVKVKKKPENKKPAKAKKPKTAKKKPVVKVSKAGTSKKTPSIREDKLPADFIKKLDAGKLSASEIIGFPKAIVEKIKIYESTKQIVQKRQKDRHELVETRLLRVTLGKLFEIHVNEFLTIKAKSIPDIAGIFGITDSSKMLKAEKVLDDELWKVLKHIKYEFNKFLTRTGNDKLD